MEDYNERFDELRRNRVEVSSHKYGSAKKNFGSGNVQALPTVQLCIDKYNETGNTEYLCDAANYLMFEFTYPQHPKAHFKATNDTESAGIIGISETELESYRQANFYEGY